MSALTRRVSEIPLYRREDASLTIGKRKLTITATYRIFGAIWITCCVPGFAVLDLNHNSPVRTVAWNRENRVIPKPRKLEMRDDVLFVTPPWISILMTAALFLSVRAPPERCAAVGRSTYMMVFRPRPAPESDDVWITIDTRWTVITVPMHINTLICNSPTYVSDCTYAYSLCDDTFIKYTDYRVSLPGGGREVINGKTETLPHNGLREFTEESGGRHTLTSNQLYPLREVPFEIDHVLAHPAIWPVANRALDAWAIPFPLNESFIRGADKMGTDMLAMSVMRPDAADTWGRDESRIRVHHLTYKLLCERQPKYAGRRRFCLAGSHGECYVDDQGYVRTEAGRPVPLFAEQSAAGWISCDTLLTQIRGNSSVSHFGEPTCTMRGIFIGAFRALDLCCGQTIRV